MPEIPEKLKLGGLEIEIPEVARQLGGLVANGTTFAQVNVAPGNLIPPLPLQGEGTVPLKDARFTLGGSVDARLAVSVFNQPGDVDEDGILQPSAGRAWLKHQLKADIQGNAAGTVGKVGFGLDTSRGASLAWYRAHPPSQPVAEALAADVSGFLLPLDADDVLRLGDGDILAFTVKGSLALHARLTWADALSAAITSLDNRLGVPGASAIQLGASASVAVSLGVQDDFRLVFRRGAAGGATRVEVRKVEEGSLNVAAGFSLDAGVSDPETLLPLLDAYATSRLGQPWDKVQALAGRVDQVLALESLSPEDRDLAEKIGGRLGLDDLRQDWQKLRVRLTRLPGDLRVRLEQAVKTRLQAQVTLEYSRVSSGEVVLACELSADALRRHHGQLLLGNLADLTAALADGEAGYRLIEYLKSETLTTRRSFGVSLSLGRWSASGTGETLRKWSRETDLKEAHELRGFTGQRAYQATWGDRTYRYALDFSAAMRRFSAGPRADANDFRYSLTFGWSWSEPLTGAVLSDALDLANVWNVSPQERNDANVAAVLALAGNQPALIEVQASILDDGFRALLATPPGEFLEAWTRAMAAALPRVRLGGTLFRGRVDERIATYLRAARFVMDNPAGAEIAGIAGRVDYPAMDPNALNQLQSLDRGAGQGGLPDLGLKVLWATADQPDECRRARKALDDLAEAISDKGKPEQIEETFGELQKLLSRPYEHRLLGRLVTTLVAERRPGDLVRTVRVTPQDGEPILI